MEGTPNGTGRTVRLPFLSCCGCGGRAEPISPGGRRWRCRSQASAEASPALMPFLTSCGSSWLRQRMAL